MKVKFRTYFFSFFLIVLTAEAPVFAGIQFGGGDINKNDDVLFTVRHTIPGLCSYRTLFTINVKDSPSKHFPQILTCYPEQMEVLDGGKLIQIRNRYGTAHFSTEKRTVVWNRTVSAIPETSCRTAPVSVSGNGKWFCFVDKKNYASGALTLCSIESGRQFVLDENALLSNTTVPVKWQDGGQILLYEKNGTVYFCNPEAMDKGTEVSEEYRKIGKGSVESVNWANGKYLIYIDGDIVYRINSKELYTLGLYSGIIGKGTTIGRLPNRFSPQKDSFSVSRNLSSLLLIQNKKNFTLFHLNGTSCNYLEAVSTKSYTDNNASLLETAVIWPESESSAANDFFSGETAVPFVCLKTLPHKKKTAAVSVYKMDGKFSSVLEIENTDIPSFSPDRTKCAFFSGSTASVYDTSEWKKINEITGEKIISLVWTDADTLYLGGDKTIRKWMMNAQSAEIIMLSQATNAKWSGTGEITAENGTGKTYIYNRPAETWSETSVSTAREIISRNENYRVFCGETPNARYENALYVRSLKEKPATNAVFAESIKKTAAPKTAALLFDAYDNADGLAQILYELTLYGIPGTFFLNGEFIRRYPNETSQLALSGHECASLFFSTTALVSEDFIMNEEFIRRGLARNEDEFFSATGKELSLLWHAPYYKKTEDVVAAGKKAGYSYVDTSVHSYDTVTLEEAATCSAQYFTTAEIIDIYMKTLLENGGGIIPVTAGIAGGSRKTYVYDSLDLLINAILDEGFQIVPVRTLIQKAE